MPLPAKLILFYCTICLKITQEIIQAGQFGKRRVVYIGKPEKIRKIIENEQKEVHKKQEILESVLPDLRIAGDIETFTVGRQNLKQYGVQRRKKKIFARHIITESPLADDELKEAPLKQRDVRVISKSLIDPKVHVAIWKNHVSFTIWDKDLHTVIITNRSIYTFMKSIFEVLWIQARGK
jgi:hypothetical protein